MYIYILEYIVCINREMKITYIEHVVHLFIFYSCILGYLIFLFLFVLIKHEKRTAQVESIQGLESQHKNLIEKKKKKESILYKYIYTHIHKCTYISFFQMVHGEKEPSSNHLLVIYNKSIG